MGDTWDDSDDEWDVDDDDLDARLGLNKTTPDAGGEVIPNFDDEEDLALKEKAANAQREHLELKKKGTALAAKKAAEKQRQEELEVARQAMALEAEAEANLSPEQRKALKQKQVEEADNALTDDLFGNTSTADKPAVSAGAGSSDKLSLKDMKDHLKHARRIGEAVKAHGKIHLTAAFVKEVLEQCKGTLDDDAITDIIKTCNVIKNEKIQQAKRKVKGQAQKSKKADKQAEQKARQLHDDTFGDNDRYDEYDQMGADYEDAFF